MSVCLSRGAPGANVEGSPLEAVRIPAGEDDIGALGASSTGTLETDSAAAADDDDRLPEQFRHGRNRIDRGK